MVNPGRGLLAQFYGSWKGLFRDELVDCGLRKSCAGLDLFAAKKGWALVCADKMGIPPVICKIPNCENLLPQIARDSLQA